MAGIINELSILGVLFFDKENNGKITHYIGENTNVLEVFDKNIKIIQDYIDQNFSTLQKILRNDADEERIRNINTLCRLILVKSFVSKFNDELSTQNFLENDTVLDEVKNMLLLLQNMIVIIDEGLLNLEKSE